MKCLYCSASVSEAFVVKRAVKPPRQPHRWAVLGHCCETCDAKGRPLATDPWAKPAPAPAKPRT